MDFNFVWEYYKTMEAVNPEFYNSKNFISVQDPRITFRAGRTAPSAEASDRHLATKITV
jgi:hypothetical protein